MPSDFRLLVLTAMSFVAFSAPATAGTISLAPLTCSVAGGNSSAIPFTVQLDRSATSQQELRVIVAPVGDQAPMNKIVVFENAKLTGVPSPIPQEYPPIATILASTDDGADNANLILMREYETEPSVDFFRLTLLRSGQKVVARCTQIIERISQQ